jgi:MFS family permease
MSKRPTPAPSKDTDGIAAVSLQRPGVTLLLASAQFVMVLGASMVVIALPNIQQSLVLSPGKVQWVVTSYSTVFGGVMLAGGRAADLYGRRHVLTLGMSVFAAGSLVAGLAVSGAMLLAARALQGLGSAAAAPAALALIASSVPPGRERHNVVAINGVAVSIGFVVGALIGGLLTALGTWRAVFLVNVPIAIAVVVLGTIMIDEDAETSGDPLDVAGASAVTVGSVALIYAITSLSTAGAGVVKTLAAMGGGVGLMVGFGLIETRRRAPFIPRRLLAAPAVVAASACVLLVSGSAAGVLVLLTIYVQRVLGLTPLATAVVFLIPGSGAVLGASVAVPFISRKGTRATLIGGLACQAAGAFTLATLTTQRQLAPLLIGGWLDGLGIVIAIVTATIVVTATASDVDQGAVAGLLNSAMELGSALGIALFIAIAAQWVAASTSSRPAPHAHTILGMNHALLAGAGLTTLAAVVATRLGAREAP